MLNKLNELQKARKTDQRGFTIIEIMIVLAIAGLIMLIVFLAIPALQRNSRNTSRKEDVGRIGAATTEFVSNNDGKLPQITTASYTDAQTIVKSAGNLGQYDFSGFGIGNFSIVTGAATVANPNSKDKIQVVLNAKCGSGGAATSTGASNRQMALQYAIENSGGTQPICTEL
jgi:prepilin-type N-terminal cleavage/methylation domain-containing protein